VLVTTSDSRFDHRRRGKDLSVGRSIIEENRQENTQLWRRQDPPSAVEERRRGAAARYLPSPTPAIQAGVEPPSSGVLGVRPCRDLLGVRARMT
jgi:hypothetical protein